MSQKRESVTEVRREMLETIGTRGIRAAVMTAIDVCEDKKAPANARATAAGFLLRADALGGFARNHEGDREKEPHEMSPAELDAAIRKLRERSRDLDEEEEAGSAFG